MTTATYWCEWCGGDHPDTDDYGDHHDIIVNLHMHTRTFPELIRDAIDEVASVMADRLSDDDRLPELLDRLESLRHEVAPPSSKDLEVLAEILDDVETLASDHLPGLLALSDGGNTGDWLIIATTDDD